MAGAQTARQWSQPIAVDNAVRAAFGEVEGYERIAVHKLDEVRVKGNVVADVTHLLAELLENAINFSEPHTSVDVTGRLGNDGYHIVVEDHGIGMSYDELVENNSRITDPPPLDQVPTRFLGLYVVGRLAERHEIQVRLAETNEGGISAKVSLPTNLIVVGDEDPVEAPIQVESTEVETSPLEEQHDLDAELASMTEEYSDSDDDLDSSHGSDDDLDSSHGSEADTDSDSDSDADVESDTPVGDATESGLPTRPVPAAAGTAAAVTATAAAATAAKSTEQQPAGAPIADSSDGGLPVRNKGGALEQATPMVDRAAIENRSATDSSEEAAGNFSSMMSALSSGVSRGLEDSENEESTEGTDHD